MNRKKFAVSPAATGKNIKNLRETLALTQEEFSSLVNVSKKTVERWETQSSPITGPIVTLIKILSESPEIALKLTVPPKVYPIRIWYMFQQNICTLIDVDEGMRKIAVTNFTDKLILRAFGKNEHPSFEDYEAFLESRCFPRSRDKMKLILKDLNLPFYDPIMIIEKTEGRMAEDDFWIKIER